VSLWIATGLGVCCGTYLGLLRAISPDLAGRITRGTTPLWALFLCVALMFFYDAEVFGHDWYRALAWALVAFGLTQAASYLFSVLHRWLQEGRVQRVTWVVMGVAGMVCVSFFLRLAGW